MSSRLEDIAHPSVFLASNQLSRNMTGQTLVVAGGREGRLLGEETETDTGVV